MENPSYLMMMSNKLTHFEKYTLCLTVSNVMLQPDFALVALGNLQYQVQVQRHITAAEQRKGVSLCDVVGYKYTINGALN